jgi:hypothetical protein
VMTFITFPWNGLGGQDSVILPLNKLLAARNGPADNREAWEGFLNLGLYWLVALRFPRLPSRQRSAVSYDVTNELLVVPLPKPIPSASTPFIGPGAASAQSSNCTAFCACASYRQADVGCCACCACREQGPCNRVRQSCLKGNQMGRKCKRRGKRTLIHATGVY